MTTLVLDQNFILTVRLRQADAAVVVQPSQPLGDFELGRFRIRESEGAEVVELHVQPVGGHAREGRQHLGTNVRGSAGQCQRQVSLSSSWKAARMSPSFILTRSSKTKQSRRSPRP